jgi:Uma2 family endonuclease
MGIPTRNPEPMTAQEFFAFTATRPDDERWELIDGEPLLNASASHLHQRILRNLIGALARIEDERRPKWEVLPGIGVRVSPMNVPVPDVLIRPFDDLIGPECDDLIVAFEILSPSTADRDLRWKRQAYAKLPSLVHYVVIAQDGVEVFAYDRANDFAERRLDRLEGVLDLPEIDVSLPLSQIYRDTGLESA